MNQKILKQTFRRTIKWYPLVLVVMLAFGFVLYNLMGDPWLAFGLTLLGSLVGPLLEAVFYYQEQVKKEAADAKAARAAAPRIDPAERLRQAKQLLQENLIDESEFEHIRQAVVAELAGELPAATLLPHEILANKEEKMDPQITPQTNDAPGAQPEMKIHPILAILVALSWPAVGILLGMLLEMIFDIDLSKLVILLISLAVSAFGAFYLFPVVYRAPFGKVAFGEYLRRIGLYLPSGAWRHILLGVVLAACTLSGMLVGSLLTGRYQVDWSTVNLTQTVLSLNAGIFEEIFYRGIIVLLLLPLTQSVKKAAVLQIIIFGLAHIKGTDALSLVDAFSVAILAISDTYVAYKTRSLLAGIVWHILHDALLFFVQVPEGVYIGWQENVIFYALLWLMVAVECGIVWFAAERLNVRGERELYTLSQQ